LILLKDARVLSAKLSTMKRTWLLLGLSVLLVGAFYLLREHWGHALGLLPYALLLACPLLHLFHGHGGHGGHHSPPEERRE
jgi:hypothetical protein